AGGWHGLAAAFGDGAAVLAQVHRDAVRARLLGDPRRGNRVGVVDPPRLAQRGDVIDVDPERDHKVAVSAAPIAWRTSCAMLSASRRISRSSSPSSITRSKSSVPE